jgi:hypothetical protein
MTVEYVLALLFIKEAAGTGAGVGEAWGRDVFTIGDSPDVSFTVTLLLLLLVVVVKFCMIACA